MRRIGPLLLLLAACGDPEPVPETPATVLRLQAVRVAPGGAVVIDGTSADEVWNGPHQLRVPLSGGGPSEVTLRAAYDDENFYLFAQWPDPEASYGRFWRHLGGTEFEKQTGEDGFSVCWSPGRHQEAFRERGCAIVCHDGRHRHELDRSFVDFWYWGSQQTAMFPQARDMVLRDGPLQRLRGDGQPERSDNILNQSAEFEGPGFAARHLTKNVQRFLTVENAQPLRLERLLKITQMPEVPLDLLRARAGSRGDVRATARHVGRGWTLEMRRALDTGHLDDQPIGGPLVPVLFSVAIHDASEGAAHAISPPIELRFVAAP